MTEKKEVYDGLKCGNCGYDGGESHLKEKLLWQQENHQLRLEAQKAKQVSDATHQTKYWVLGLASVICISIMSYSACDLIPKTVAAAHPVTKLPEAPVNPVVHSQEVLKDMYSKCVEQANNANRSDISAGLKACNDTFSVKIDQMRNVEEKK